MKSCATGLETTSLEKLKYLDSMRGLAALIVFISHYTIAFYPELYFNKASSNQIPLYLVEVISKTPLNLFYAANFAVCIFFILSGYVLTNKFFLSSDSKLIIRGAVKRYFRLFPLIFLSMLSGYIGIRMSLFHNVELSRITNSAWLAAYLNFEPSFMQMISDIFINSFFSSKGYAYNPPLWTMYIEFYGSMLVFFLAYIIHKSGRNKIIYVVSGLLFIKTYYLGFILGMLLSDLSAKGYACKIDNLMSVKYSRNALNIMLSLVVISGICLGTYPLVKNSQGSFFQYLELFGPPNRTFLHIFGAFLVFAAVLFSKAIRSFLSQRLFVFLGNISFSFYVIHFLVLYSFSCYLFLHMIENYSYHISFLITIFFSLIITLLIAAIVDRYIDKQGIVASKLLASKLIR